VCARRRRRHGHCLGSCRRAATLLRNLPGFASCNTSTRISARGGGCSIANISLVSCRLRKVVLGDAMLGAMVVKILRSAAQMNRKHMMQQTMAGCAWKSTREPEAAHFLEGHVAGLALGTLGRPKQLPEGLSYPKCLPSKSTAAKLTCRWGSRRAPQQSSSTAQRPGGGGTARGGAGSRNAYRVGSCR